MHEGFQFKESVNVQIMQVRELLIQGEGKSEDVHEMTEP
jgi:hypothetical protein